MSRQVKNIKDYSNKLYVFLVLNCIIYMCFSLPEGFSLSHANDTYTNVFVKNGIAVASTTIIVFLLNGLLTSDFKAKLVFWRRRHVYPGFRVFTTLIDKDCRINRGALENIYGKLPIEPNAQNELWYKIFKKDEFHPMVFDSHRSFLLSRDLTAFSFLLLCMYPMLALVASLFFLVSCSSLIGYLLFLLAQYLSCSLVSQHYGNRFACNVLAHASVFNTAGN